MPIYPILPTDLNEDLSISLQEIYRDIYFCANGNFFTDSDTKPFNWEPTLTSTDLGSFNYLTRCGVYWRRSIVNELFFHIQFNHSNPSGFLGLHLPSKIMKTSGQPFIGHIHLIDFPLSANYTGISIKGISNDNEAKFFEYSPTLPEQGVTVPASGALSGHFTYIGVSDD